MASQRQIRSATVQALYAAPPESLARGPLDEQVLDLLLEPLRARESQARARALLHLQQGRPQAAAALDSLSRRLPRLQAPADGRVAAELQDLLRHEHRLHEALDQLRRELKSNAAGRLPPILETCRTENRESHRAAGRLRAAQPSFPDSQSLQRDALAACADLAPFVERAAAALATPAGRRPEFRGVAASESDIATLTSEVRDCLAALAGHLPEIDRRIDAAIQHYRSERLDRVDRAVLRLATYELLHVPEVPPAVAINEAVELARTFGTSDSARFVNGVLDAIRKQAAAASNSSPA